MCRLLIRFALQSLRILPHPSSLADQLEVLLDLLRCPVFCLAACAPPWHALALCAWPWNATLDTGQSSSAGARCSTPWLGVLLASDAKLIGPMLHLLARCAPPPGLGMSLTCTLGIFFWVVESSCGETLNSAHWTQAQVYCAHRIALVGSSSCSRESAPMALRGVVLCRHCSCVASTFSRASTGQGQCVLPCHCTTIRATLTTGLWSSS